ncbi:PadR family transcriptional regulator [Weissella minor]|uniref:Transcription regulator PadR N-terminal domain-containing protein n=1 Tax=Weissella minor TaxID=1620 RepID=A0A0R2JF99_9LACO|nr:PadR family transcriptional regulator [Weissella minor]KRN75995.1 hypothetical protein IV67_GL001045 [Weissella minor]
MYDLLILGMLMAHDYSGYKLAHVLGQTLIPRRKISNGVMYPLLDRLEKEGYIQANEREVNGRRSKVMHITDLGRQRFYDLMDEPIAQDAKRDDMYRFKFRGFGHIASDKQLAILDEYQQIMQNELDDSLRAIKKLSKESQCLPDERGYYEGSIHSIELDAKMHEAQLAWVAEMKEHIEDKLEEEKDDEA